MANARLQMAQQQLAYKRQDELAAKEQQAQAEENAAARTVAQWNANVRARMEEQLAKGDTIWTWTDESGKIHWTTYESRGLAMGGKKLSPSSSKVKATSSSGSSSKKKASVTYSGGSNSGSNSNSNVMPSTIETYLLNNGRTPETLVALTKEFVTDGRITEAQATKFLNKHLDQ